jgi:hypothetical protein
MATQCKVICPNDGEVVVYAARIVIDVEEMRYRFVCPGECQKTVDKRLNDEIYELLRAHGSPTIDDLCMSFSTLLDDERNLARFILTAP